VSQRERFRDGIKNFHKNGKKYEREIYLIDRSNMNEKYINIED
jgi:hypothetical protein